MLPNKEAIVNFWKLPVFEILILIGKMIGSRPVPLLAPALDL